MKIATDQLRNFHRYSVGVFGEVGVGGKLSPKPASGSGFIIEHCGDWWLVTAAHVVEYLLELKASKTLLATFLVDSWTGSDGLGRPIPFPLEYLANFKIFGDSDRFDVAAIHLGGNHRAQLEAATAIAFTEEQWQRGPNAAEFYLLLGTPGELIESTINNVGTRLSLSMPRAVAVVDRIDRPAYIDVPQRERFYGHIPVNPDGDKKLSDIVGVSGGPILACRRIEGDVLDVWPVAVQSGWYSTTKVVVADLIWDLAPKL